MITISQLAKEYGIHRNTMHRILNYIYPNKKPYILINDKLYKKIRNELGKGKFVKSSTICKMYGITYKTFICQLKNAEKSNNPNYPIQAFYAVFYPRYSKKLFSPKQQDIIFHHLGKPKTTINESLIKNRE